MLATNPNMTGEATASYLADRLRGRVRVTRLASGLPGRRRPRVRGRGDARARTLRSARDVTRLALRTTALVDAAFGFVLLLGTWDRLYSALHLPLAHEPFYAQIGGAFVVGMAYLLWRAHRHASLEQGVALGAGVAHGLAAAVAIAWLLETGSNRPQPLRDHADAARGGLRRPGAPGPRDCQAGRGSAAPLELTAS